MTGRNDENEVMVPYYQYSKEPPPQSSIANLQHVQAATFSYVLSPAGAHSCGSRYLVADCCGNLE